jgi:hypothetical protein
MNKNRIMIQKRIGKVVKKLTRSLEQRTICLLADATSIIEGAKDKSPSTRYTSPSTARYAGLVPHQQKFGIPSKTAHRWYLRSTHDSHWRQYDPERRQLSQRICTDDEKRRISA